MKNWVDSIRLKFAFLLLTPAQRSLIALAWFNYVLSQAKPGEQVGGHEVEKIAECLKNLSGAYDA